MDYKGSKRRVLILGLIMVVLITAHASKDSYDAEKASKKKKKMICCVKDCIWGRSYYRGITIKENWSFVKRCCRDLCVPVMWIW